MTLHACHVPADLQAFERSFDLSLLFDRFVLGLLMFSCTAGHAAADTAEPGFSAGEVAAD